METAITSVENCKFPKSAGSGADETKRLFVLSRCRKKARYQLKQYLSALATGDNQAIRAAMRSCLRSRPLRICAAVDANKRFYQSDRISLAETFTAAGLNVWHFPPFAPQTVWVKKKPNGGMRAVWEFDMGCRTMHGVIAELLQPTFTPQLFQYEARWGDKGIQTAIRHVKAFIKLGYVWVFTLDIVKHYPSFEAWRLCKQLPLSKKVVDHYVMAAHLKCEVPDTHGYSIHDIVALALQGIPQGSALSPVIATMINAQILWNRGERLFNWADNFLILAKTKEAATAAKDYLIAAVAALPGGKFDLKLQSESSAADGFEFLGHSLRLTGEKLRVEPSRPDEFFAAMRKKEPKFPNEPAAFEKNPQLKAHALKDLGDMWVLANSWAQAFSECDPDFIEECLLVVHDQIEHHWAMIGEPWNKIALHKNSEVQWKKFYV